MTTAYQDIRGALQSHAVTATGFPAAAQRAYEGRPFEMTVGTPWARMTLMPTGDGPFDVSANVRYAYGLFQVDVFYPSSGSPGTLSVEQCADNIIAVFKSGTHLYLNSIIVIIDRAQRGPIMTTEDWLQIPVTISWRSYPAA